ncbi:MAG: protein-L-isoaspartate O-methyltransferase [Alphaproteobacteria bacterium]|nr:protein-L-isoaspartate O-methyltransferase [Alphaproteobacteria bacterium]
MTLQNFEKSREAMVVSQLQPSGIMDVTVNEAFLSIPRENYVPQALRGVCYLDDDIALGHERSLLEPLVLALMIQDASLNAESCVLDIGGATGYSAAVEAQIVGTVIAVDSNEKLLHEARMAWKNDQISNITPVLGRHQDGYKAGAPYDAIFINGAVEKPSEILFDQLSPSGKLYCVVKKKSESIGKVTVFEKTEAGQIYSKTIGEAATPYLEGFIPKTEFKF